MRGVSIFLSYLLLVGGLLLPYRLYKKVPTLLGSQLNLL